MVTTTEARATLEAAREIERERSAEVDRLREEHALGRVERGPVQKAKYALARAQEEALQAEARVRVLEREANQVQAQREAEAIAERRRHEAVVRAERVALSARIRETFAEFLAALDELEDQVRAHNQESRTPYILPFAGPSNYRGDFERLMDSARRIAGRY